MYNNYMKMHYVGLQGQIQGLVKGVGAWRVQAFAMPTI